MSKYRHPCHDIEERLVLQESSSGEDESSSEEESSEDESMAHAALERVAVSLLPTGSPNPFPSISAPDLFEKMLLLCRGSWRLVSGVKF